MWDSTTVGATTSIADDVANAVAAYMDDFGKQHGFTGANLSVLAPAYVVITPSGTPLYKVLNSTLYIPLDVAKNISPGVYNHTLLHELAHWIQDVAYNMTWASTTGGRWWIETAADNMVMLVDPAYVSENLTSYGRDSFTDQPLSLQLSPYQWPREEFYVQAQIVKLNMCHDPIACPLSEASFAQAINKGTFPYDDSTAKAKLSANLDDYALYLLGVAPRRANSAIPRGAANQFGVGYGESINIRQSYNELFFLETTSYPPQVQKDISGALPAMAVSAVINKDGVYPLLVNAGKGGKSPGLPAALVIQPGAPFWYNVDGSEPQYHDGSTELRIMPIHLGMGAAEVSVVALGKQGGEVFQARVEILDLSGAWAFLPGKLVRFDWTCDDDPESAELLQMLGTGLFVGGTFSPDAPGSNGLSWSVDASKMPPDYDASMINLAAEALVDVENVRVQAHMELLPPTTGAGLEGAPDASSVALAALGVFPLAVFISWRGRRRVGLLAVSLALLSLVGCEGFSFSGTVDTDLTFTRLEYVGNETSATIVLGQTADTAPPPLWRLSGGSAVYTVDITVEVHEDTGPQITSCSGEVVYEMVANIYTEAALIVPEDIE
jgi:hypothetical protein